MTATVCGPAVEPLEDALRRPESEREDTMTRTAFSGRSKQTTMYFKVPAIIATSIYLATYSIVSPVFTCK